MGNVFSINSWSRPAEVMPTSPTKLAPRTTTQQDVCEQPQAGVIARAGQFAMRHPGAGGTGVAVASAGAALATTAVPPLSISLWVMSGVSFILGWALSFYRHRRNTERDRINWIAEMKASVEKTSSHFALSSLNKKIKERRPDFENSKQSSAYTDLVEIINTRFADGFSGNSVDTAETYGMIRARAIAGFQALEDWIKSDSSDLMLHRDDPVWLGQAVRQHRETSGLLNAAHDDFLQQLVLNYIDHGENISTTIQRIIENL